MASSSPFESQARAFFPSSVSARIAPYTKALVGWFVAEMGSFGALFIQFLLTVIAAGPWKGRLDAPACLGKPFRPST